MMELLSDLTCTSCSKIFKSSIKFPCNDAEYKRHLSEPNVLKDDKKKCAECNQEFNLSDVEFITNITMEKLREEEEYLSKDERKEKKSLEKAFEKFENLYQEFIKIKDSLETECHDHFSEMRRNIDLRREELKSKIDEICLEMIEKTKRFEAAYQESIREKIENNLSIPAFEKKFEEEKRELFGIFHPSIDSMKFMKSIKQQSISELKSKLDEFEAIKDHLKTKNDFIIHNNFGPSAFGMLYLNIYDPFNSNIITCDQSLELIKLCEFSLKDKWTLLYRASLHGFDSNDFHYKCDGKKNTLTIIKEANNSFVFGGYNTVSWDKTSGWKKDSDAFIFSLTNKLGKPTKMKIAPTRLDTAIFCESSYGASFGRDLEVLNEGVGRSDLGYNYRHDRYQVTSNKARSFLAGSLNFFISDVEVYMKL